MKKLWMLFVLIVLYFIACDMPATGGNPGEGTPCHGISRKNAYSYMFFFELDCPYGEKCKTRMNFIGSGVGDTLDGRCFLGYELRLETADTSRTVLENKNYPISLTSDNHAKFSLFDINNVEKKYDIDLSEIINSYTVRGDSVDVNVMNGCSLWLFSCKKGQVYGNDLFDGKYTFLRTEGCDEEYSYDCLLHNQGPSKKDDLDIHAMITWTK